MTKPTPGPYRVQAFCQEFVVYDCDDAIVAKFPSVRCGMKQAEANARAWVEGREAAEKLDRIRASIGMDWWSKDALLLQIKSILDEAKP